MKRIEYQILDHGCDGAQYFPGCGVSFTRYTHVETGIGDSPREAAEDALEMMYQGGDFHDVDMVELEAEVKELSEDMDTFTPEEVAAAEDAKEGSEEELNPEWHHYVSIRWRIMEVES